MIGMDSYLNAYVDRRMQNIVDEWDLSTGRDLETFTARLAALEQEIPDLKASRVAHGDRLTALENRAKRLKGLM
ncbi:MAG: hypothetical protein GYA23_11805 [Methanomicrobiales archaeon]|nr:hypothetical protein [Methanomicrobiales archaeon]